MSSLKEKLNDKIKQSHMTWITIIQIKRYQDRRQLMNWQNWLLIWSKIDNTKVAMNTMQLLFKTRNAWNLRKKFNGKILVHLKKSSTSKWMMHLTHRDSLKKKLRKFKSILLTYQLIWSLPSYKKLKWWWIEKSSKNKRQKIVLQGFWWMTKSVNNNFAENWEKWDLS